MIMSTFLIKNCFRPSTVIQYASVFKSFRFQSRFRKALFSLMKVSVFHRISVERAVKSHTKVCISNETRITGGLCRLIYQSLFVIRLYSTWGVFSPGWISTRLTKLKLFHDYKTNFSPGWVRISVQTEVKSQPGLKRSSLKKWSYSASSKNLKCCSYLLFDFCRTVVAFKNRSNRQK